MERLSTDQIKEIEKNILKEFDRYCSENNLRYCVDFGTLLGAIRHKGFIPWDDDIDVSMPRPDYERFKKMCREIPVSENIAILSQKISRLPYIKLCDMRTITISSFRQEKYNMPVWIDIFPVDGVGSEKEALRKNKITRKLLNHNRTSYAQSTIENGGLKKIIVDIYNIICPNLICRLIDHISKKYKYINSKKGFTYFETEYFDEYYFDKIQRAEFEDIYVNISEFWENKLVSEYGDYMTPPPEDQRNVHMMEAYLLQ